MLERTITGKTKLCGVIGDPIEHTMSPLIQNAAFQAFGLDFVYVAFRVKNADLDKAVDGMRAMNIVGLNVTVPHKVAVIPFLDKLDPLAEKIGAVNTIVNHDGILTGYNTDALGFLQPLFERGIGLKDKNVVILGAGGAARGISFVLAQEGARLVIFNRTLEKAEELCDNIAQYFAVKARALEPNDEDLRRELPWADILVNTTSVGMVPRTDEAPIDNKLLSSKLIVYDIVYNPLKTRLLAEAESAGAQTIGGLEMLVWQGALAFEKWTGYKAPVGLMKEELAKALQK